MTQKLYSDGAVQSLVAVAQKQAALCAAMQKLLQTGASRVTSIQQGLSDGTIDTTDADNELRSIAEALDKGATSVQDFLDSQAAPASEHSSTI